MRPLHRPILRITTTVTSDRRRTALLVVALAVGLLTWADLYARVIRPSLEAGHFPTSTYWVAPRLVITGRAEVLYDVEAFGDAAEELGALRDRGFIPNAPPAVLPLLPLGLLPQATAYVAWTALSVASVVAAIAALARSLRLPALAAVMVVAALPLFQPARANFAAGQEFSFVLLALSLAVVAAPGLWLGIAAVLKSFYGLVPMLRLIMSGRRRQLAVASVIVSLGVGVSLLIVGVEGWQVWIETSLAWRSRPETSVTAYQTLNSLFGHLLRLDPTWNPGPVFNAPVLADMLWWLVSGLLLLTSLRELRHGARPPLAVALLVPVAILTSPIAEDYHYLLTVLPFVVGGTLMTRHAGSPLAIACFVAALLLIVPPWPFNQQPVMGIAAVLFYPRVYGAILLWLALMLVARGSRVVVEADA